MKKRTWITLSACALAGIAVLKIKQELWRIRHTGRPAGSKLDPHRSGMFV